jgi:hypothetical protein
MKLKTLTLATSIALSAMSAAGTAQAGALSSSLIDMTNLTIFRGGAQVDVSDLAPASLGISNTADISTQLGATTLNDNDLSVGQDIDLGPLRLGDANPAYANNAYTAFGSPTLTTFSLADQSQFGSPISGLVVGGDPIDPTATSSHAAYVSLLDEAEGSSTANNGLNTTFAFALGESGALDFGFDARAYLEAFTTADEVIPSSASASMGLIFTLVDLEGGHGAPGGTIMNWEPDGSNNAGSAGAFGITAENDPFDLTQAVSRNSPVNGSSLAVGVPGVGTALSGTWSATTLALLANNDYQLTIRSTSEADAVRAADVVPVPEPATLALMGLGLLGLGLSRRRRT